ncbi:MAG: hypothetical protein K2G70_03195 [Turicibacter sp.]|nr:hypothetical protein [Turicibacter sp.]
MKFIAKEQPKYNLKIGDVIEYFIGNEMIRFMIVKGYDEEGCWGYKLFNIEENEVPECIFEETEDILNNYQNFKGFRIIKSSNLELREV